MMLRHKGDTVLSLGIFLISSLLLVSAKDSGSLRFIPQRVEELKQTINLSPDHAFYDSSNFDGELAASAVSPFCKSFAFLCHVRCLQRGDPNDAGNVNELLTSGDQTRLEGEINRCSQVPNSKSIRVLCLCNNGVDLTAEVDYALEGVVDIKAAGGDGTGTGEAGQIREVAYIQTKTEYKTVTVTETKTTTATVTQTVTKVPKATSLGPSTGQNPLGLSRAKQLDAKKNNQKKPSPITSLNKGSPKKAKAPKKKDGRVVKNAQSPIAIPSPDDKSYLDQGDWIHNPESYQEPYLAKEYMSVLDDQERAYAEAAEVEAESVTHRQTYSKARGALSKRRNKDDDDKHDDKHGDQHSDQHDDDDDKHDDNDNNADEDNDIEVESENEVENEAEAEAIIEGSEKKDVDSGHGDESRYGQHRYDYEEMYPPFDVEAMPSYKNTIPHGGHHKNDKDQNGSKSRAHKHSTKKHQGHHEGHV
ncbi:hypothetical protein BGX27_007570 [Mortierella sp. AM989]|nr:hypothetical protein BGX27_007570 [Mortierella sp. AM989]